MTPSTTPAPMRTMTTYRFIHSLRQAQETTGRDYSEAIKALREGNRPFKLLEAWASEETDRLLSEWLDHLAFAMRNAT